MENTRHRQSLGHKRIGFAVTRCGIKWTVGMIVGSNHHRTSSANCLIHKGLCLYSARLVVEIKKLFYTDRTHAAVKENGNNLFFLRAVKISHKSLANALIIGRLKMLLGKHLSTDNIRKPTNEGNKLGCALTYTVNLHQILSRGRENTVKITEEGKQTLGNRLGILVRHHVVEEHFKKLVCIKNALTVGQKLCSHSGAVTLVNLVIR